MTTFLLCADGSTQARSALARGLTVLGKADRIVLAMAVAPETAITASGAGTGRRLSTSAEGDQQAHESKLAAARKQLQEIAEALDVKDAELSVISGTPGPAICALAESLPASAVVLGTRGHGGIRRAMLGSVSDHVVRNASCPVVITA